MKKTIIFLIFAAMLLLTACTVKGKTTESVPSATSTTASEETPTPTQSEFTETPTLTQSEPTETPTGSAEPEEPRINFKKEGDGGTVAVWWWNANDAWNDEKRVGILDFLEKNAVNEIYFCYPNPNGEKLNGFVREANTRGMAVSLLSGDVSFIEPGNKGAEAAVHEFLTYQNAYPDAPLKSLHLDVEPHQSQDFSTKKTEILQKYADYLVETCKTLHDAGEKVEFDLPFWFDEFRVEQNGEQVDLLTVIAQNADGMTVMAYRDNRDGIYGLSEKEIALAKEHGCRIVLGVDCYSTEGTDVSFMEVGQRKMYSELKLVYKDLWRYMRGKDYGIAIHYVDTWMKLKE